MKEKRYLLGSFTLLKCLLVDEEEEARVLSLQTVNFKNKKVYIILLVDEGEEERFILRYFEIQWCWCNISVDEGEEESILFWSF